MLNIPGGFECRVHAVWALKKGVGRNVDPLMFWDIGGCSTTEVDETGARWQGKYVCKQIKILTPRNK